MPSPKAHLDQAERLGCLTRSNRQLHHVNLIAIVPSAIFVGWLADKLRMRKAMLLVGLATGRQRGLRR